MNTQCPRCNGTGKFFAAYGPRMGQAIGDCFKCQGTGVVPQKSSEISNSSFRTYNFPRIVELALEQNVKLRFDDCKLAATADGRLLLVAPIFGQGIFGSFSSDGTFKANSKCTEAMIQKLQKVEAQGMDAVKEYSRLFGWCCMCGRTLTNEGSIEDGIGPICAGKSF